MSTSQPEADYELYLRSSLTDATRSFDKTITALAAGALALSVTFLKEIAGANPVASGWLLAGWFGLIVSLTSNALSYLTAERTFSNALHNRDHLAETWNRFTTTLNALSGVGLAVGLAFLGVFAYRNL
jgi:hypothetical protein